MEFLSSLGIRSHVGTDSEVIARILDYLVRVKGLDLIQAAKIISNPYERTLDLLADEGRKIRDLILAFRGAQLDGPFTVIAGYSDGKDTYLLGFVDRSKFRPMVVGEDDRGIYMASEECQIKLIAPKAKVWTPEPGGFILASVNKGLIEAGRRNREIFYGFTNPEPFTPKVKDKLIDAEGLDYHTLNNIIREQLEKGLRDIHIVNVRGQRYIGVSLMKKEFLGSNIHIYGTPGNCLANFNMGLNFYVYGNAEDDVGDAMHAGKIVIFGDARDVIAQAFQGGDIFVRGSVGNRAGIQMREYKDKRPYFIVGGRADDYFCEYMAGGVALLLGLGNKGEQITGNFVATGMVGGRIYIRAKVREDIIGLPPKKIDVLNYLRTFYLDGSLDEVTYNKILSREWLSYHFLKDNLPPKIFERVKRFYVGKYVKPLNVEYRELNSHDLKLIENKLKEYFDTFKLNNLEEILSSKFTVITTEEELKEEGEAIVEE
ncbi:Glutamate synthase [NADPH] large chain [archaeon HR06]|nr:Glutamate synthase [NADPH] large chain [archaeon HR06]